MQGPDRILYVQVLAQMLIADGVLADDERAHLETVMNSLEMPGEERATALAGVSMDSPVEERVEAMSAAAREGLLSEVEKAVTLDGEMSRSEEWFLERVRKLLS